MTASKLERIAGYVIHPAASQLPLLSDPELAELALDIKQRGQRHPVVMHAGQVLDGRNRLRACELAGVEPRTVEWESRGETPVEYVLSANLQRRHLNQGQRAMIAAQLLPMLEAEARERQRAAAAKTNTAKGRAAVSAPGARSVEAAPESTARTKAAEQAGKAVGVSSRYVEAAKAVAEASPELAAKVRSGEATLKQAEKAIRKREKVAQIKAYRPPEGLFPVIVSDFPWKYDDQLDGSDEVRGGCPYPPMTVEEICAFPIPADRDCVHFMWVTNAHLIDGTVAQVLRTYREQGWSPKTVLTWVKDRMGNGHWLRGQTEHCILLVRGKPTITLTNQTTVLHAKRGAHSEKPEEFYALVESLCPAGPKLELFARREREGWVTSGAEVPASKAAVRSRRGA